MTTTQTISRERLEEIKEFGRARIITPINDDEILALVDIALAAMGSVPYGYVNQAIYEAHGSSGLSNDHEAHRDSDSHIPVYRHASPPASAVKCSACRGSGRMHEPGEEPGDCSLCNGTGRLAAPPAPVAVADELSGKSFEYIANKFQVSISEAQWILVGWNACRAAMQSKPVTAATVPDGWKLVPVEPTEAMLDAAYRHPASTEDRMRKQYDSMLAAAPAAKDAQPGTLQHSVPGGWIKFSEMMPERDHPVYCFGQYGDDDIDDDKYGFRGYLDKKGRWFAFNNGDYVDGGYGNDYRARVTHWMPLPSAPEQEV